jgi:hypothetical protein
VHRIHLLLCTLMAFILRLPHAKHFCLTAWLFWCVCLVLLQTPMHPSMTPMHPSMTPMHPGMTPMHPGTTPAHPSQDPEPDYYNMRAGSSSRDRQPPPAAATPGAGGYNAPTPGGAGAGLGSYAAAPTPGMAETPGGTFAGRHMPLWGVGVKSHASVGCGCKVTCLQAHRAAAQRTWCFLGLPVASWLASASS